MRELFHEELAQLGRELAALCGLACAAMEQASRALLEADLALAERVIAARAEIQRQGEECERHACVQLALQAPVAKDLRIVVTAIRASEKIARMGDLACHVAEIARLRHPRPALPAELRERFGRMCLLALRVGRHVEQTIAAPVATSVATMERLDDELDWLLRDILDTLERAQPAYPVQAGIDAALLARYVERFADQAVSITRQLDYVLTGDTTGHPDIPPEHQPDRWPDTPTSNGKP